MPQNVLGLDIGSFSIKAALFDTTFRSYALTDLFESPPLQADEIDANEKPVVITEAILRLIQENHLRPTTIVTALPGLTVSTRNLVLPLAEKQIGRVLPFELETYLPFDIDEVIADHHVISTSKNSTTCLAAAVKKSTVAEHLALLQGAGLEPAFVGLDSLFLYNLNQLILKEDASTYAIIDLGHQKTSICIVSNHQVQFVRTLFTAGAAVTESIRTQLDLTLPQAIEAKHGHGIIEVPDHPLRSEDLQRLSKAIREVVEPLTLEVLQTFQAYRAQKKTPEGGEQNLVEQIYLCGGTSLIRNLPEQIASQTGIPTSRVRLFPENSPQSGASSERDPVLAPAVAFGLRAATRGAAAKRVATINFRLGDFAFARDLSGLKEKAFYFGKWIVALFLIALLHVGVKYQNLAQERSRHDRAILTEVRRIAPDLKPVPRKASSGIRQLRAKITNYKQKQEILTAGLKETTALGVLREISTLIPADTPLDTQELSINRNQMTLRALTDSFASVDRIIAALSESPSFSTIEKGPIREATDGKKAFQLTVTIGDEKSGKKRSRR